MSGGMMVHSASLSPHPTSALQVGQPSSSAIRRRRRARARCATLRYFSSDHPKRRQNSPRSICKPIWQPRPAAGRGSARARAPAAAQLVAQHRQSLGVRPHVDDLDLCLLEAAERHRMPRAPPASGCARTARAGDRGRARGSAARARSPDAAGWRTRSAAGVRDQLERRLAVAVLEILPAQSVAMYPQQQLALGACHQRDLLRRVEPVRRRAPQASERSGLVFAAEIG